MLVDRALYRHGQREHAPDDLGEALRTARATGAFLWVGLFEPAESELDDVAREFELHPLAVEDAVSAHQRPKLERYEHTLFCVLKTIQYIDETSDIEVGEIMVFAGDGFIVTVRHGEGNPLGDVRRRLETSEDRVLTHGSAAVFYAVMDRVVDSYEEVVVELERDIDEVEQSVFSAARTNDAERVYKLKREILEFRRSVVPLVDPVDDLATAHPHVPDEARPFFRDVHDHLLRVRERVDEFDAQLTDILNANLAQVSVRQNDDMRRITAWVAIVAVPTLIAGIYGMNFTHMPELHWTLGYPFALLLMAGICVSLYVAFRRSGWL
ncbi:MAG: magnesium/cobalt transporter CorA [Streptosporangiales bacterium]|nr:magnesium/cobalt transporter CorA [Streptosporangiales bacterium]